MKGSGVSCEGAGVVSASSVGKTPWDPHPPTKKCHGFCQTGEQKHVPNTKCRFAKLGLRICCETLILESMNQ